jgi:DNA-binding beta-propeller fold protein YncE
MRKRYCFAIILLTGLAAGLSLVAGCRNAPRRLARPETVKGLGTAATGLARVTIYLDGGAGSGSEISLRLAGLELGGEAPGSWEPLDLTRVRLRESELRGRQVYLGSFLLEPQTFSRIRLELDEIVINRRPLDRPDGKPRRLEIAISRPQALEADSSTCLFLDWPAANRPAGGDPLAAFGARFQSPVLARDQISVLCRDISTIYFVSPDRGRVTAALGLPGPLGETAIDSRRLRFYVVGSRTRGLYAIDAGSFRLVDTFALPLTQAPSALVLSRDLASAYVSDTLSDRILKLNPDNGFVNRQTLKVLKPGRLFYLRLRERDYLGVISPRERSLTLLDPETLEPAATISIDGIPAAVVSLEDRLYVADRSAAEILVYSFPGGRLEYSVRVGRKPTELVLYNRRIYIATRGEEYLSILLPRQRTTLRRIPCGPDAVDLAIARNWRKLYVANRQPRELGIIDLNSGRRLGRVRLGGEPVMINIWEP